MASVFISHSSHDRAVTERVVARLRADGFAALFVDFDPEQGIPAGRRWERELYARLRRADAVIFLASEASVASSWCLLEVGLARSLGRPVFPLRLQPGVELPLLADVQWTDLTDPEPRTPRRGWPGCWPGCTRPDWIRPTPSPGIHTGRRIRAWPRSPRRTPRCSSAANRRPTG
jgi:hypothetical protein